MLSAMAWYFRILEREDGSWSCAWGPQTFDSHQALADAVEHCSALAAAHRPAQVLMHPLDGDVQSVAVLD
jgi:hypothetical protein